jgi:hypothetical protein
MPNLAYCLGLGPKKVPLALGLHPFIVILRHIVLHLLNADCPYNMNEADCKIIITLGPIAFYYNVS